jgi:hypothetical protein
MAQTDTTTFDESLTARELAHAGASATYIAYYLKAKELGESTASTRHAEKVVNRSVNYSGGGFHDSLWVDTPRYPDSDNPYGADGRNANILREAGVAPYDSRGKF